MNSSELEDLACNYAEFHAETEALLLSGGFYYCDLLFDAAGEHSICGDSFVTRDHSIVFCALCECALRSRKPSVRDLEYILRMLGEPKAADDLQWWI